MYQHCKEKHLHRYLAEFDFHTRKITDMERTIAAVRGGEGKRLTYHQPHQAGLEVSGSAFLTLATQATLRLFALQGLRLSALCRDIL